MDDLREELLEVYKLHAKLADNVSQRREGANRLYVTLITGFIVLLVAMLRFGSGDIPVWIILAVGGVIGALISASWFVVVRSYKQLNSGKFAVLQELEEQLAFPFFTKEWENLGGGENRRKYLKMTVAETSLLAIFFLFSIALIVIAFTVDL